MKRLNSLFAFVLISTLLISSFTLTYAVDEGAYLDKAKVLNELGLFKGTDKGFELSRKSNRAEAAIMLVRLLGGEQTAFEEAGASNHPFVDVPQWADPYVAYLYKRGLTKGISDTLFGSKKDITAAQYTTMLLRALGYSDEENNGEFRYYNALKFAHTIGIDMLGDDEFEILKSLNNEGLKRDYLVMISYKCLLTSIKGKDESLLFTLAKNKTITYSDIEKASQMDDLILSQMLLDGYFDGSNSEDNTTKDWEIRAVWISYLELQNILPNKSEEEFRTVINKMFKNVKNAGLNTVIVQVRPFGDAIYPSEFFPWSYIATGTEGVSPGFDPLKVMVEEAHNNNLKFEAWINPYRIRNNTKPLSTDNQALVWMMDGSNRVVQINSGIFYNPANKDVQQLITNGVMEIVRNYDVDGIHFDDYFYPTTDLGFDSTDYQKYLDNGGALSVADWRRENVNQLVRSVYSSIKSYDSSIKFGISPEGIIKRNYDEQYIDVEKWLSSSGYVDYICPQIYFGFNHGTYPYDQLVKEWNALIKNEDIHLYIGLAAYKLGREDKWAGDGKTEWINTTDMLQRMIQEGRKNSHYLGFVLFRYDSLWNPPVQFEEQIHNEMNSINH